MTTGTLRIPPHSIEAEQSVIGGLLIDNKAWDLVSDQLTESDFYINQHRLIFAAITELAARQRPFDLLTVFEVLKAHNSLESAGWPKYIYELLDRVLSTANIAVYSEIVRERSILRRLINAAYEIQSAAHSSKSLSIVDLLDESERSISIVSQKGISRSEPTHTAGIMARAYERMGVLRNSPSDITGLSTGFSELDKATSGWQPGDLIIIGARPSMGKTAFAMNLAEDIVLNQGKGALVFSMEMPGEQLGMRFISSIASVDHQKVRTATMNQDEWKRVGDAVSTFSKADFYLDDTPGLTPSEIRSISRRLMKKSKGAINIIIIDYLQLMHVQGKTENRTQEVGQISRALKGLARELKVPVIALSQLNRELEKRGDKRPVMSDLRESGAVEADADVIAFIYRDEVYDENSKDKGKAEIIISKQRNGPIGTVTLNYRGEFTRFEDSNRIRI